jgi:serine/threonine protein phosphatase PrpC
VTYPALIADFAQLQYRAASRSHPGAVRDRNEDALLSRPTVGLWAVCDGMGGHCAGELASALTVARLGEIGRHTSGYGLLCDVRRRLHDANLDLIARRGREGPTGATVVVFIAYEEHFACLWAGDSRAYRLSRGGGVSQITHDHSLAQELEDSGSRVSCTRHSGRASHVVTRALGVTPDLEFDFADGLIAPGDRFLLCSDGLTDTLSDGEIAALVGADGLESGADRLLGGALDRQAADNVSFILIGAEATIG